MASDVPEAARAALLALARRSLHDWLSSKRRTPPPGEPEALRLPRGVFVTLTQDLRLRGCIGYPAALKPLGEAVVDCAIAAATSDPRFPPLQPHELDAVAIEISVLSAPVTCTAMEIEVGRDGLIIARGRCLGLLLPQVAVEHGWNRETFLVQACKKAGLEPDAWRRGARIERFSAEVFAEPGP